MGWQPRSRFQLRECLAVVALCSLVEKLPLVQQGKQLFLIVKLYQIFGKVKQAPLKQFDVLCHQAFN